MAMDSLSLNCPYCGEPVKFVCTAEDAEVPQSWSAPVFACPTHGMWYLTQEGLRREPPTTHL
jgi:hypothetical protein